MKTMFGRSRDGAARTDAMVITAQLALRRQLDKGVIRMITVERASELGRPRGVETSSPPSRRQFTQIGKPRGRDLRRPLAPTPCHTMPRLITVSFFALFSAGVLSAATFQPNYDES